MKILKWLLTSKTGIAVLIAIPVVIGAAAAQFYYFEKPVLEKKEALKKGGNTLEKIADALEKASKDGQQTWPRRSEWFPKNLPCAASLKVKRVPPWDRLGFEEFTQTQFQYRLDTFKGKYILRARSDSDCDGVFAIHTIEGATDWTSSFRRTSTTKNSKE